MKKLLTAILLNIFSGLCMAQGATAQSPNKHVLTRYERRKHQNVLTANVPNTFYGPTTIGFSAGLEFERFINAASDFSVSLPFYQFFGSTDGPTVGSAVIHIDGRYIAPGIMYHTNGSNHRTDFSFGPHLTIGNMRKDQITTPGNWFQGVPATHNRSEDMLLGFQMEFNLAVQSGGGFVFAPHFGLGIQNWGATVQFGLKFGGRF